VTLSIAVLISGRGSNLKALLDATAEAGFPAQISCVLSNVASAPGLEFARTSDIPVLVVPHQDYQSKHDFEAALIDVLSKHSVDLICLAGFMRLLSADFIARFGNRIVNIHPSLLPAFPGLDTHSKVLAAGVRFTGCTVHFVSAEMDSGPIITQASVPVHQDDTEESLAARVLRAEHLLYPMAVRMIAEDRVRIEGDRVVVKAGAAPLVSLFNPAH